MFALGFIISQQVLYYIYKKEGKPVSDIDVLTVFMVIATIVGARLGHVFFYEPAKYLANPIEILMIQKGGLASHGAAVGILFAIWLYSRYDIRFKSFWFSVKRISRPGQSYLQVLDRLVIFIAMTGALIRIGNFINSEIEGEPTGGKNGVLFAHNITERLVYPNSALASVEYAVGDSISTESEYVPLKILIAFKGGYDENLMRRYMSNQVKNVLASDAYASKYVHEPIGTPLDYSLINDNGVWTGIIRTQAVLRYPSQLYEAAGYFLVFVLLFLIWRKYKENTPEGRIFGLFLIILWSLRILFEFVKENQVEFEEGMKLNMGQILSVPLVLVGVFILIRSFSEKAKTIATKE